MPKTRGGDPFTGGPSGHHTKGLKAPHRFSKGGKGGKGGMHGGGKLAHARAWNSDDDDDDVEDDNADEYDEFEELGSDTAEGSPIDLDAPGSPLGMDAQVRRDFEAAVRDDDRASAGAAGEGADAAARMAAAISSAAATVGDHGGYAAALVAGDQPLDSDVDEEDILRATMASSELANVGELQRMQLVLARVEIAVRNLEPASHAKLMTDYELPVLDVAVRELQRDLRVIENEVSQRFTDAFVSELGTVSNLRRCEPTRAQRDHATGDAARDNAPSIEPPPKCMACNCRPRDAKICLDAYGEHDAAPWNSEPRGFGPAEEFKASNRRCWIATPSTRAWPRSARRRKRCHPPTRGRSCAARSADATPSSSSSHEPFCSRLHSMRTA